MTRTPGKMTIGLYVDTDFYHYARRMAREANLSLSRYCETILRRGFGLPPPPPLLDPGRRFKTPEEPIDEQSTMGQQNGETGGSQSKGT